MFGFGRFGPMELVLIFIVALLIFGPKKFPEIGRSIGRAIREFKDHSNKLTEEFNFDDASTSQKPAHKAETAQPDSAEQTKEEKEEKQSS